MLLGVVWGLRRGRAGRDGLLLPAFVIIPALLLLVINSVQPAYMTARHMSVISGGFVLLLAVGLAVLWQWRRWAGGAVAVVLLAGMAYSTVNYYTADAYDKGDLSGVGNYLSEAIQPGDALLTQPETWTRLFRYYLPVEDLLRGKAEGHNTDWQGLTLRDWPTTEAGLAELLASHPRLWLMQSDGGNRAEAWLDGHVWLARTISFASPLSVLKLNLYLPQRPILKEPPADVQQRVDADFGGQIRLQGYTVGARLPGVPSLPVTLYWQAEQPITARQQNTSCNWRFRALTVDRTCWRPQSASRTTAACPPTAGRQGLRWSSALRCSGPAQSCP